MRAAVVRVPAAVHVPAAFSSQRTAGIVLLQNDVDHAGDCVGPVLRGGAVEQYLHVIDRIHGNEVEIGSGAALVRPAQYGKIRRAVTALAVDQDESVVGAQAPQLDLYRLVGHVATKRLLDETRNDVRQ